MKNNFPSEETLLYKFLIAEKEEILKHKWLESEKSGYDIGFDKAFLNWIINHGSNWRKNNIFFSGTL